MTGVVIGQGGGTVTVLFGTEPELLHKGAYQWKCGVKPPPSGPALWTRPVGISEIDIYWVANQHHQAEGTLELCDIGQSERSNICEL